MSEVSTFKTRVLAVDAIYIITENVEPGERVQISIGDSERVYICVCPTSHNHMIVHREYDNSMDTDTVVVMSKTQTHKYVESLQNITFIGIFDGAGILVQTMYEQCVMDVVEKVLKKMTLQHLTSENRVPSKEFCFKAMLTEFGLHLTDEQVNQMVQTLTIEQIKIVDKLLDNNGNFWY